MSQPYPPQPADQQPPGWGPPQPQGPAWGAPPPPPKKSPVGKILGFGCLGIVVLLVVIGAIGAALGSSSSDTTSGSNKSAVSVAPSEAGSTPAAKETKKAEAKKSQAQVFQACVAKSGTATEKTAVKHVTKVQGVDEQNNILDSAEVYTDYGGDMFGAHAKDAKLIASAFASCYDSDNGLVTVYSKAGEILSNGNF